MTVKSGESNRRRMEKTRWDEPKCDICGTPITIAICDDVRMYRRYLDDNFNTTTETFLHYRLCRECSGKIMLMLSGMKDGA